MPTPPSRRGARRGTSCRSSSARARARAPARRRRSSRRRGTLRRRDAQPCSGRPSSSGSCTRWRDGSASSARSTGRARPANTRNSRSGWPPPGRGCWRSRGRSRAAAVAGGGLDPGGRAGAPVVDLQGRLPVGPRPEVHRCAAEGAQGTARGGDDRRTRLAQRATFVSLSRPRGGRRRRRAARAAG